ncbi:ATP-binding protein [Frondihabitans cladoniiphilus]|uniref:ATP-binding protein n=1 Tax=Frondihabitans cladoniiphilus TaxID=715785 RepID=A0ABP8VPX5_9MICO
MTDPLLDSLRRAVESAPDDVALRLHLGRLLIEAGQEREAVEVAAALVALAPDDAEARALLLRALSGPAAATPAATPAAPPAATPAAPPERGPSIPPAPAVPGGIGAPVFDWSAAEEQVEDVVQPAFVDEAGQETTEPFLDVERPRVTLKDVGGMSAVKERLNASFLAPLQNPELRKLYGKSLRGGLLLYGPPGCGKTFLARALAGELGASFLSIGLTDVLDMYIGNSERNLHEAFQLARRTAPCVLFIDEIDALGQRRSQTRSASVRGIVNQLLAELDGVTESNENLFVPAATNQPWDVDPALRRPGRFDRTVLVLPPDTEARASIFRSHLAERPVEAIDAAKLARASDGLSGADIAYVCELASERALLDSVRSGTARYIRMEDLEAALGEVRPSTGPWLDSARNVVQFGDDDGTYAELRAYLKKNKRL